MPEMNDREKMVKELQQLRRGHGVHAPDVISRVGPRLALVCGLDQEMSLGERRQRLVQQISAMVMDLPEDLRTAVQAAFALAPASQSRFLRERMSWLGVQLQRDPRTAMRRVESGLTLLAERMLDCSTDGKDDENHYAPGGWYVELLRATLMLHVDPVQLLETRRVTSTREGLDQLTVSWSIPADAPASPAEVRVEMLYGGELIRDEVASTPSYWTGTVRLPRTLGVGDEHEYQVRVTSLDRRFLRPYYVLSPFRRTDEFELRAKFDPINPPARIWHVDGVPFQLLEEKQSIGEVLEPDAVGEVASRFRNLQAGLSYGLRWQISSEPEA